MTHVYLGASALAKLVILEHETPELRGAVRNRSMATSRVAVVEVAKAAARAGPEADPSQVLSLVTLLDFDSRVAALAATTGGPALRALDAIHVATALMLGPELESFITYDTRQAEAARAAGLHVVAPGAS